MGRHSTKSDGDSYEPGRPIPKPEKDEKGKPEKGKGK